MDALSSLRRRARLSSARDSIPGAFLAAFFCLQSPFTESVRAQATTAPAESTPEPPRERRARLTFDPTTDTWEMVESPEPGTEDGDLDIARQYIARQDYQGALPLVKEWIKQYGTAAPRYPEAIYLRGVSLMELGDYRGANDDFTTLLRDYPGSGYAERTLSARFRVGEQYLAGKKRKAFFGLFRVKDREAGVKIMDEVITNYADTPLAEMAQKSKADYYFARGEFEDAQEEYATFAREFPRSRYHAYALMRSGEAALGMYPGVHFDDAGLVEAQERFNQFMQQYPGIGRERNVPTLQDEIAAARADKTFQIGRHYEKYRKPQAARYYYRQTVMRWPGTPAAEEAQGRLNILGDPEAQAASEEVIEIEMPATAPATQESGE